MKFKGKATPKKGVDKGTKMNRSNLTIKLLIIDLMTHWKLLIVTDKYLLKMRALYCIMMI